jgi:hypothetical protein
MLRRELAELSGSGQHVGPETEEHFQRISKTAAETF